jgi:hypothetical protein
MPLIKRTPLNLSIGIEQCHNIPKVSFFFHLKGISIGSTISEINLY